MHMKMTYRWIEWVIVENLMFLVFCFEPLSLSYDPKREGHPFKLKGIIDPFHQPCSNVLQFPIKNYSFEIFTILPSSSLVMQ